MGGARRVVGREEKDEEEVTVVAVVVVVGGEAGLVEFGVFVACCNELSESRLDISCDCV